MAEDSHEISIRFPDLSDADANVAAASLRELLLDETPGLQVATRKASSDTQDLGTILTIVLGAPSAIAVAHGIQTLLAKLGSRIEIETTAGKIMLTGTAADHADSAKLAREMTKPADGR